MGTGVGTQLHSDQRPPSEPPWWVLFMQQPRDLDKLNVPDMGCRMLIRDLLPSRTLAELLQLRVPAAPGDGESSNWFSVECAATVLRRFRALDEDSNGHLSQTEFAG